MASQEKWARGIQNDTPRKPYEEQPVVRLGRYTWEMVQLWDSESFRAFENQEVFGIISGSSLKSHTVSIFLFREIRCWVQQTDTALNYSASICTIFSFLWGLIKYFFNYLPLQIVTEDSWDEHLCSLGYEQRLLIWVGPEIPREVNHLVAPVVNHLEVNHLVAWV